MSRLYVGNLPPNATEGMLEEVFQAANHQVDSIKLVRDMDTGLPRGFAFVDLAAGADMQKAITDLNGRTVEGKQLIVNEARPKRTDMAGGGGGGRRFDNRPNRGGRGGGGHGRGGGGGGRGRY